MMSGLPASGKTKRAFELYKDLAAEEKKVIRVHPQMVLNMLHFYHRDQPVTRMIDALDISFDIIDSFLKKDYTVIIDDINLNPGVIQGWKILAESAKAEFEIVKMDVPVQQCVFFDTWREDSLGYDVINAMAMEFGLFPPTQKEFVLVDVNSLIDGEYDVSTPEGKKAFRNAPANELYLSRMQELAKDGYKVVFYTSMNLKDKGIVVDWLNSKGLWTGTIGFTPATLFVGLTVKTIFETYFKGKYPVFRALTSVEENDWKRFGVYVEKI